MNKEKTGAVVLYMPVIHQGYLRFIQPYKETHQIFLIGQSVAENLPTFYTYYGRDLRRISVGLVESALKNGMDFDVEICTWDTFTKIPGYYDNIVMPEEDLSNEIIALLPAFSRSVLRPTSLRWDKLLTGKAENLSSDFVITYDELAKEMLKRAYTVARASPDWWRQVGCVIITKNEDIVTSYNKHLPHAHVVYEEGDPRCNFNRGESIELSLSVHAEAGAIAYAAKYGIPLNGACLYVTTFPCPNCARLIVESGVQTVYFEEGYSLLDAKEILASKNVKLFKVEKM
jgi:dCMP deaminase